MTRQIFIIGLGNIGGGLYQLIQKRNDMQVAYVCNSKAGVFLDQNQSKSLSLSDLKNLLQNSTSNQFSIDLIQNHPASSKYLIDCTSSQSIPLLYPQLFSLSSQNIKIITPNKKTVSEDINLFNQILKRHETNQFHFETTVCAGLPVINLVKSLVDTHQKIYKISGMFSGTLSSRSFKYIYFFIPYFLKIF